MQIDTLVGETLGGESTKFTRTAKVDPTETQENAEGGGGGGGWRQPECGKVDACIVPATLLVSRRRGEGTILCSVDCFVEGRSFHIFPHSARASKAAKRLQKITGPPSPADLRLWQMYGAMNLRNSFSTFATPVALTPCQKVIAQTREHTAQQQRTHNETKHPPSSPCFQTRCVRVVILAGRRARTSAPRFLRTLPYSSRMGDLSSRKAST